MIRALAEAMVSSMSKELFDSRFFDHRILKATFF